MEYEQIKKIMDDMGESKLSSLEIAFPDGTKISLKKEEKVIVKKDNGIIASKSRSGRKHVCIRYSFATISRTLSML